MFLRGLVLAILTILGLSAPWMLSVQELENHTVDARFWIRGKRSHRHKIVVIAVDDATEKQWRLIPKAAWSGKLAEVVRSAYSAGANRVALDFVFSVDIDNYLGALGVDQTPNADLASVIAEQEKQTLLGSSRGGDVTAVFTVSQNPAPLVSVNGLPLGTDTVRAVPRFDQSFTPPLIGLAAALSNVVPPEDREPILINYSGCSPQVVSAVDVANGLVNRSVFANATVIIGETYAASTDVHNTPFGSHIPGVLIQGEAALSLLDGCELRSLSTPSVSVVGGLFSLLFGSFAFRFRWTKYLTLALVVAASWMLLAIRIFAGWHFVIPLAVPLLMMAAPVGVYMVRAAEEEVRRLRYGPFIPEGFVRRIEANRQSGLGTIGRFEAVPLFLDVVGYSEKVNRLGDTKLALDQLNILLKVSIGHIRDSGGVVLDFMGDGLYAFFEVSQKTSAHDIRERALSAAINVLRSIERLNSQGAFGDEEWDVRIGLSFGGVDLALVGTTERRQMSVLGPAVNLASRLEQLGKDVVRGQVPRVTSRLVLDGRHFASIVASSEETWGELGVNVKGFGWIPVYFLIEDPLVSVSDQHGVTGL